MKRNKNLVLALTALVVLAIVSALGVAYYVAGATSTDSDLEHADRTEATTEESIGAGLLDFPKSRWPVAGIRIENVATKSLPQIERVTGTLALNEDRQAQIYPQVEGVAHQVPVRFGDHVVAGQTLVVVDSQQIGLAKLELIKSRLDSRLAEVDFQWETTVEANVQKLIVALQQNVPLAQLESKFADSDMGDYRAQLISAYARLYKSRADHDRLKGLSDKGITAGKDFLAAQSTLEADQATMQAMLEQTKFTARQRRIAAEQTFEKAKNAESTSELNLRILGINDTKNIGEQPPIDQESFSHYTITAPFDGSVIFKDIALEERVDPTSHLLTVADLSTVWVRANVFEKQVPLALKLLNQNVHFRTNSYPSQVFEARVFSIGSVIDDRNRTLPLTAIVDNSEKLLKPGMFVDVELPGNPITDVIAVPQDAIQDHENEMFVFVHLTDDQFERRDVKTGRSSDGLIEITDGLLPGEAIVVEGGFFLKSQMLSGLLAEDD